MLLVKGNPQKKRSPGIGDWVKKLRNTLIVKGRGGRNHTAFERGRNRKIAEKKEGKKAGISPPPKYGDSDLTGAQASQEQKKNDGKGTVGKKKMGNSCCPGMQYLETLGDMLTFFRGKRGSIRPE